MGFDTVFVSIEDGEIATLKEDVDYYFKLLSLFADTLLCVIPKNEKKTLAVAPFRSSNFENSEGIAIAEGIIFYCKDNPFLSVIDYQDFKSAVKRVSLYDNNLNNIPLKVAQDQMADYAVSGNIVDVFGQRIINGVLKDTKTGEVINVVRVAVSKEDLNDATSFVLREKSSIASYTLRSMLLPGWGQIYANKKRGVVFMFASVASYAYTVYSWLDVSNASEDQKSRKTNIAKNASFISLGIWGLNIIDASILGYRHTKKYDLYFVNNSETNSIEFVYRW